MDNAADRTGYRAADVVVLSGNPDDAEVAALVAALAALSTRSTRSSVRAPLAPVAAVPATWAGRERYSAPAGWASGEGRHLRRVA